MLSYLQASKLAA